MNEAVTLPAVRLQAVHAQHGGARGHTHDAPLPVRVLGVRADGGTGRTRQPRRIAREQEHRPAHQGHIVAHVDVVLLTVWQASLAVHLPVTVRFMYTIVTRSNIDD